MIQQQNEPQLFVVIGSMKSGTTTLFSNLARHPEIEMSKNKETNFFSMHAHKGINWYRSLFRQTKPFHGDISPSYSRRHLFPETVKNLKEHYPAAKIVYVVRHPIDRIVSHLHHDLYRDRLKITEAQHQVLANSDYKLTSSYYYQVEPYLENFAKNSILVLSFEDLKSDLNGTLNKICKFIGASQFNFDNEIKIHNTTDKRYWIKSHDMAHRILPSFMTRIYHWMFYFIGIKIKKPKLSDSVKAELKEQLKEDSLQFYNIFGVDVNVRKG